MERSLTFHLHHLPVCLALVQLLTPCSAQFAVIGPPEPILALVGEVTELPCHLSPKTSAETMDLIWVRSGLRQAVRAYADGKEETEMAEYPGRTSILREDIAEGKAALRIHKVRASDSGTYQCYFQDADFLAKAQVELQVADPFFSSVQLWWVVFMVIIMALLGLQAGVLISRWQQQKRILALIQEKERDRITKEPLQDKLRWTKKQYLAQWKIALYQPADVILDQDTVHPKLLISEDQRSLQYTYTWQNLPDNPRRFQDHYCVLGRESFMSGRHFWEVEVGDRKLWQFGVCRENVERKYYAPITPQNGFWTIARLDEHDFQAQTDPWSKLTIAHPPERVGVFLDYESGEVSFYDAIDGSYIYTFSQASFSGPLLPFFWIWSQEPTALTICPALKGVGSSLVSDPLPGPFLKSPVASGSGDGNEDPQAEESSLLPPALP